MICAYRNCNKPLKDDNYKRKYCCDSHKGKEAYQIRANNENPDRKRIQKEEVPIKKNRFEIKTFSAQWLQDAWDERKRKEAV